MKSRLALAVMLALGMLFTFSGVAAIASHDRCDEFDDAAQAQYFCDEDRDFRDFRDHGGDGRNFDSVGTTVDEVGTGGDGKPDHRQDAAGGDGDLAFGGFAAIPLLVVGLGLLAGGTVLSVKRKK